MSGQKMRQWLTRVANAFRHFRDDADLKAELQVHLELHAEDNAGPGVSIAEAPRPWSRMFAIRSSLPCSKIAGGILLLESADCEKVRFLASRRSSRWRW